MPSISRQRLNTTERVISNVVMMGMGEPLQNYRARSCAAHHARRPWLRPVAPAPDGIDPGVVPMMDRPEPGLSGRARGLAACAQRRCATSAADQPQVPAAELMEACKRYLRRRRATSSLSSTACSMASTTARSMRGELIALVREHGVPRKFNLIPSTLPGVGLTRSARWWSLAFADQLNAAGIVTTVRKTRGDDIDAACGQLAATCSTAPTRPSAWHSAAPRSSSPCAGNPGSSPDEVRLAMPGRCRPPP